VLPIDFILLIDLPPAKQKVKSPDPIGNKAGNLTWIKKSII